MFSLRILFPLFFLISSGLFAASECQKLTKVSFKSVVKDLDEKTKNYQYFEGQVGDYVVWAGDVKNKIINIKEKSECVVKVGIVDPSRNSKSVEKTDCGDVLLYDSYSGSESWNTLVEMKTCEKIWERRNYIDYVKGVASKKSEVIINKLKSKKLAKYKSLVKF